MKAVLIRTGSVPVFPSFVSGSPRVSLSIQDSVAGVFSGEKSNAASLRISMNLEVNRRSIRRVLSESDVIRSESDVSSCFTRSKSFPARIPEEECVPERDDVVDGGVGSLMFTERGFDQRKYGGDWSGIPVEELGFCGGGHDKGRKCGGGNGDDFGTSGLTGGSADWSKLREYYKEMLKSNPTNSLLLRNYGKFLDEVERDPSKAEEYYGRAILASPGDGEVLSLYGKLIWETERDEDRAQSYFDQAVHASPDDCSVLGSYAHFMWEAEEDDEDEEKEMERKVGVSATMVEAF